MSRRIEYLQTAIANEEVFRNILNDLKTNRASRPMGIYVPEDIDTSLGLEELYKKYSEGNRRGIFTISGFRIEDNIAIFRFEDVAFLSGGGASLKYNVYDDKTVKYLEPEFVMMS